MKLDYLIIGQGLAGSTLALELLKRNKSVLVVDRQDPGSSTRVAAGLITPLTGKGMNSAWRQTEYLSIAEGFYRNLEKQSGRGFYHSIPVMRLFRSEKEQKKWQGKKTAQQHWAHDILQVEAPLNSEYGGIEMPAGAWLDTRVFLQVVKDYLVNAGSWVEADFSENDVLVSDDGIQWRDNEAEKIILCQGAYGLGKGGWFGAVPHRSAKGEVLSLRLDGLDECKRYHSNGWLAPRGGGVWKAGANYDWVNLDSIPTESGKEEVLVKLKTWVNEDVAIEIVGHQAGVRPIIRNSRPVIGFHPEFSQVAFFNGLGSKGSLMAPAVAAHFASFLSGECELDDELALHF